VVELHTTASSQIHQPAPKTAPATPGPKIAHNSIKSIFGSQFHVNSSNRKGNLRVLDTLLIFFLVQRYSTNILSYLLLFKEMNIRNTF